LSRKQRATPAVARIFGGGEGSPSDCLGLFQASQGTRTLDAAAVGKKVVELQIVDRASDSTIGRTLKKTLWRTAGRLHAAARSRLPAGVPGRDLKATAGGNAGADPDETGTSGPLRLRVRAQRHRQPLLEGWSHIKVTDRHTAVDYAHVLKDLADVHFAKRQNHRSGPGQSQHPQQGVTLRSLSRR
jgi:hypothetical protein